MPEGDGVASPAGLEARVEPFRETEVALQGARRPGQGGREAPCRHADADGDEEGGAERYADRRQAQPPPVGGGQDAEPGERDQARPDQRRRRERPTGTTDQRREEQARSRPL